MAKCNIEGCEGASRARDLCHKHYMQWWRKKDPENARRARESSSKWYWANLNKARESRRKWYQANKERAKKRVYKWREANPDKVKEYYLANTDRRREYQRHWKEANPEKYKEHSRKNSRIYTARKSKTLCNLTNEQEQEIIDLGCFFASLGNCEGPLCIAHNIPVSKGGNTTKANTFCLCRGHNSQMGTDSLDEILSQRILLLD